MPTLKQQRDLIAEYGPPNRMEQFVTNKDPILHIISFEVLIRTNQTPKPEVSASFIDLCAKLQEEHGHVFYFIANCNLDVLTDALKPLERYFATTNSGQVLAYDGEVISSSLKGVTPERIFDDLAELKNAFPNAYIYPRGDGVVVWTGEPHRELGEYLIGQLEARCKALNAREGANTWILSNFAGSSWLHLNRPSFPDPDIQEKPDTFHFAALKDDADVNKMPIEIYLNYCRYHAFLGLIAKDEFKYHKLVYVGSPDKSWGILEEVARRDGHPVVVKADDLPRPMPPHASNLHHAAQAVVGMTGVMQFLTNTITAYNLAKRA